MAIGGIARNKNGERQQRGVRGQTGSRIVAIAAALLALTGAHRPHLAWLLAHAIELAAAIALMPPAALVTAMGIAIVTLVLATAIATALGMTALGAQALGAD